MKMNKFRKSFGMDGAWICTGATPLRTIARGVLLAGGCKKLVAPSPNHFRECSPFGQFPRSVASEGRDKNMSWQSVPFAPVGLCLCFQGKKEYTTVVVPLFLSLSPDAEVTEQKPATVYTIALGKEGKRVYTIGQRKFLWVTRGCQASQRGHHCLRAPCHSCADAPGQKLRAGPRNHGKTNTWVRTSMTRTRGRPRPQEGCKKTSGRKTSGWNFVPYGIYGDEKVMHTMQSPEKKRYNRNSHKIRDSGPEKTHHCCAPFRTGWPRKRTGTGNWNRWNSFPGRERGTGTVGTVFRELKTCSSVRL